MSDEKDETQDASKTTDEDEAKAKAEASDDDEEGIDAANPAEIARRVAALGDEDADEKKAREEERKLAERRAAKKKGKKSGLETAASKKLAKIGQRAEPKRTVAVASDADPLIERTAKLSDWAKRNQKTVQIVGALVAIALLGIAGFMWYQGKRETEASVALAKAVEAQRARIGEPPKEDDDEADHGLYYKTFEERREAALKQYREVQSNFNGTGASILARLAEGSMLLDKRDADGAIAAYNDVKGSPLAAADVEVRGRALEGLGFAHELKAAAKPEEKDKHLDEALKVFKELEANVDVKGFKEMAMYHQARVHMNKGDKDKAKEILLSLKERLNKMDDTAMAPGLPTPPAFPYLKEVAMDRLREIDPEAAPKQTGMPGGGQQLTPAQIRKMMEDMQKKQGGKHP